MLDFDCASLYAMFKISIDFKKTKNLASKIAKNSVISVIIVISVTW